MMEEQGESGKSGYIKEIALVVVGAIIGLSSSLLTTYTQGKIQQKQLILDKQISVIKEFSTTFNQQASSMLLNMEDAINKIAAIEKHFEKNRFPEEEEGKDLDKLLGQMKAEAATFHSNMPLQLTMVYALFGTDPPDLSYGDKRRRSEERFEELKRKTEETREKAEKAKTMREQTKLLKELFGKLREEFDKLRREHIEFADETNKDIISLAKRVNQY